MHLWYILNWDISFSKLGHDSVTGMWNLLTMRTLAELPVKWLAFLWIVSAPQSIEWRICFAEWVLYHMWHHQTASQKEFQWDFLLHLQEDPLQHKPAHWRKCNFNFIHLEYEYVVSIHVFLSLPEMEKQQQEAVLCVNNFCLTTYKCIIWKFKKQKYIHCHKTF